MIETDGGNTLMLTEEEFLEVAKKMPPGEFQLVVLDILKRFIASNSATMTKLKENLVEEHKKTMTLVNENLVEEHKKVKELVDMVNEHTRLLEEYRKASRGLVLHQNDHCQCDGPESTIGPAVHPSGKALQLLEDATRAKKLSEAADVAAAIKYFEKHGEMPAGYELVEDDFENSSASKVF